MEKNYYNAVSLERVILWFERRYGMTSEEFLLRHRDDDGLNELSGFHRHAWASFYRDFRRMGGQSFAANAERLLAEPV